MIGSTNPMITNDRVYDILKYTAQIVLPALGTLYFALSKIWGFPNAEEIVGTIVAIDAFLGVILGLNSVAYNNSSAKYDGTIDVYESEDVKRFMLNVDGDPYDIEDKDQIILKVRQTPNGF